MSADGMTLEMLARRSLSGKGSHVKTKDVFSGLEWRSAGLKPDGVPHSAYQLLLHMNFWQDWVVAWLAGEDPAVPRHASGSWSAEDRPANRGDWNGAVEQFRRNLGKLERACRGADLTSGRGRRTRIDMLRSIAAHNSYHAGQVVFLRQLLGKWPPPAGGLTW